MHPTGEGTHQLTLRDRSVNLVDRGKRAPLLLVHGFPLDHTIWATQIETFAPERRVIAPDLVGFGRSGPEGRTSLDDHADDLVALLDILGVDRAVVVGLSMGGYVALALWQRHPSRCAGLVLACSRAGADSEAGRAGRYQMAIAVGERGVAAVAEALLPRILGAEAGDALRDEVRATMQRQPPAGVIAALKAMAARADFTALLPGLALPVLVVCGAEDALIPAAESRAMVRQVPGARLVVVPGAGHLVCREQPGAFNAALRAFLEAVDGRAPHAPSSV